MSKAYSITSANFPVACSTNLSQGTMSVTNPPIAVAIFPVPTKATMDGGTTKPAADNIAVSKLWIIVVNKDLMLWSKSSKSSSSSSLLLSSKLSIDRSIVFHDSSLSLTIADAKVFSSTAIFSIITSEISLKLRIPEVRYKLPAIKSTTGIPRTVDLMPDFTALLPSFKAEPAMSRNSYDSLTALSVSLKS